MTSENSTSEGSGASSHGHSPSPSSPTSANTNANTSANASTSTTAPKYFAAHQYEYEVSPESVHVHNNHHLNNTNSSSFSFDYDYDYDSPSTLATNTKSNTKPKPTSLSKMLRNKKTKKEKEKKTKNKNKHRPSWISTPLRSVSSTATETPLNLNHPNTNTISQNPTQAQSPTSTSTSTSTPYIITQTSLPMTKTIYLIRHAESDENRRQECLKSSVKGLIGKLKFPKREDLVASMELMNVGAQIDSCVSAKGQAQIDQLGKQIAMDNFVEKMGIQLVAHSPLLRARQTSYGMLKCVAPASTSTSQPNDNTNSNNNNNSSPNNSSNDDDSHNQHNTDPLIKGSKHPSVQRVVELDLLTERSPIEAVPILYDAFTKRIAEFEQWLSEQPEEVIAVVGHSLYFKCMLGLESKFRNVDVWSIQFDLTVENSIEKVREDVHILNESEKKKRIQKRLKRLNDRLNLNNRLNLPNLETIGSMITPHVNGDHCGKYGNNHRVEENEDNDEHEDKYKDNEKDDEKKDDSATTHNVAGESESRDGHSEDEGTASPSPSALYTGIQTEFDGVSLEDLELPRGWTRLRHHYRYDPNSC